MYNNFKMDLDHTFSGASKRFSKWGGTIFKESSPPAYSDTAWQNCGGAVPLAPLPVSTPLFSSNNLSKDSLRIIVFSKWNSDSPAVPKFHKVKPL